MSISQKSPSNPSDQVQQKLGQAPSTTVGVKHHATRAKSPDALPAVKNLSETSESNRQLIKRRVSAYDVVIDCLLKVNSR